MEEDGADDIQDLVSRHRSGSSTTNKRERALSPNEGLDSSDSPKRPMKDDSTSGKFEYRSQHVDKQELHRTVSKEKEKGQSDTSQAEVVVESDLPQAEAKPESDLPQAEAVVDSDLPKADAAEDGQKSHSDSEPQSDFSDLGNDLESMKVTEVEQADVTGDHEPEFEQSRGPREKKAKGPDEEDEDVVMVTDEEAPVQRQPTSRDSQDGALGQEGTENQEELDFSVVEVHGQLNVEAGRFKAILRQKGSLANRRKPTRSSIKSRYSDEDIYGDSTEPKPESNSEEEDESETKEAEGDTSPAPPVKLSPVAPKEAVLLPGLGEGRAKLRKKPAVTSPAKTEGTSGDQGSVPPWMKEARLRKSVTPQVDPDKLKQEKEAESPAWMRDALVKKKRAAEILQKQENSNRTANEEDQNVAPWMKERVLRKTNRPSPLKVTHKDIANNNHNTANTLDSQSNRTDKDYILDKDTPVAATGREILAPIKCSPLDNGTLAERDENTPPPRSDKEPFVIETDDLPHKATLPPLSRPSPSQLSTSSNTGQDNAESSMPSWKAEIAARRRSKSYIHTQRPEQPLKLGETPQWKKDLAERNKQRRDSEPAKPSIDSTDNVSSEPSLPPWKQELAQRRKRASTVPQVLEPLEKPKEEAPEWAKLAERRRARLADSGLFDTQQETG